MSIVFAKLPGLLRATPPPMRQAAARSALAFSFPAISRTASVVLTKDLRSYPALSISELPFPRSRRPCHSERLTALGASRQAGSRLRSKLASGANTLVILHRGAGIVHFAHIKHPWREIEK